MYLEVSGVKKSYGEGGSYVQVLKGINTGVEKGQMCVIQGTSGSGKSTLLNCIGGLDNMDSGSNSTTRNLTKERDHMKNNSPQKHAFISCLILVTGILLVVIGAMTTKEYKINLCLLIGAIVVIGGIVYHLIMMKCPYCGCSLVGYRPIPKECPKCHKKFE